MRIGNTDVIIPISPSFPGIVPVLSPVIAHWPSGIIEPAVPAGRRLSLYWALSEASVWPDLREALIYQDGNTMRRWDRHGLHRSTCDEMLHLLIEATTLTVIVGHPEGVAIRLARKIEKRSGGSNE